MCGIQYSLRYGCPVCRAAGYGKSSSVSKNPAPCIEVQDNVHIREKTGMALTMTSIRLDTNLADEAAKILGVKSRTEAIHVALSEIVALERFKNLMNKHSGKLSFGG
jgi:Arc/MetJ family transcription regulator